MMFGKILRIFAGAALLLLSVCFSRAPAAGNEQTKWFLVIGLSVEQYDDTWIIAVCDKDVFHYINQMAEKNCLLKFNTCPQNTYIRTVVDLSSYAIIPATLERILVLAVASSCSEFRIQFDCKYTNVYGEISISRGDTEHCFIIRPDNQESSDTINAGSFVRSREDSRWRRVWCWIKKKASTKLCCCLKSNIEMEDDIEESEVRIADFCRRLSVVSQGSEKTICWDLGTDTPPLGYYQQQQAMERRRIRDQMNRQLICQRSCGRYGAFQSDSCSLASSVRTVTQPLEVEASPFKTLISQCSSDSGYSSKDEDLERSVSLMPGQAESSREPYSTDEDVLSQEYLSQMTLPVINAQVVTNDYLYSAAMEVFRNELTKDTDSNRLSFSDMDSCDCFFPDPKNSRLFELRQSLPVLSPSDMDGDYLANPAASSFQNFLQDRYSPTSLSFSDVALSLSDVDSLGSTFWEPEKCTTSGSAKTSLKEERVTHGDFSEL
ncbi:hypothetical protein ACWJJH_20175 [Endozoicomonadaceae bacterium StTr2]